MRGSFNIDLTIKTGCHIPFQTRYSQVVVKVSLKTKPLLYPFDPTVNNEDKNVPLNLKDNQRCVYTELSTINECVDKPIDFMSAFLHG